MKPYLFPLALLLLATISLVAFKSKSQSPTGLSESGVVTAKIDGKSWQGKDFKLAMAVGGQIHIEAYNEDGIGIKMALFADAEPGIIKVGASNMSICAYMSPDKSFSSNVLTKPGVVEITEISSTGAKGTFDFYCGDDKTKIHVTEGTFDVTFSF